jgi:phospholipid transport system transporter-binding protein
LRDGAPDTASFETLDGERSRVTGTLGFTTVTRLLTSGAAAIAQGRAAVIDLSTVTGSDSSGLALLIEWLSVARGAGRTLRYENIPAQLHQLARLSEVDALLSGSAAAASASTAAVTPDLATAGSAAPPR